MRAQEAVYLEFMKQQLLLDGDGSEEHKSADKKANKYVDERTSLLTNTFHGDKYPEQDPFTNSPETIKAWEKLQGVNTKPLE